MSTLRKFKLSGLAALIVLSTSLTLHADGHVASLAIYPPDIDLTSQQDTQRFIVVATRDDGVTVDVTKSATINIKDPGIATLQESQLQPNSDGTTTLEATFQNVSASSNIDVKNAAVERPISFQMDVMPVFLRSRLQYRELPRFGARQGWVPAVSVRLRSAGRLFPIDA